VRSARFDAAYTFQYSPRPGTRAASFDDQIPRDVVQERFDRLLTLQRGIGLEKACAQVGREVEVLVEGTGKKDASTQSRTRTNRIVHLDTSHEPGTFLQARVTGAAPHHLVGEVAPATVAV